LCKYESKNFSSMCKGRGIGNALEEGSCGFLSPET